MVSVWHIYHVDSCSQTDIPKSKFVAIVCVVPNPSLIAPVPCGFFINSKISDFVKNREEFRACQIMISTSQYHFLRQVSFIDCSQIYRFKDSGLVSIQKIQDSTRSEIVKAVSVSRLIAPVYKKLIK